MNNPRTTAIISAIAAVLLGYRVFFGSDGLGLAGSSNLAAACAKLLQDSGHVGKPNNGLIGVWPHANDQGAWEIGFRPAEDLQAVFDKADVVYIAGADPFGEGLLKPKNVKRKPFLIVQDLLENATTLASPDAASAGRQASSSSTTPK